METDNAKNLNNSLRKNVNNNDIYERLGKNLINELNLFNEDELLDEINERKFSNNILYYSKDFAYNYSPFYSELCGYSLGVLKQGMPKKLNNHYLYFGDDNIQKIESYSKIGKLALAHYIIENSNERKIISIDNFNDIDRYIKLLFKNGTPIECYTMEDDENGEATLYLYNEEKIVKSIFYRVFNGLHIQGEAIYNYDEHGNLDNILSIMDGVQGIVYKK